MRQGRASPELTEAWLLGIAGHRLLQELGTGSRSLYQQNVGETLCAQDLSALQGANARESSLQERRPSTRCRNCGPEPGERGVRGLDGESPSAPVSLFHSVLKRMISCQAAKEKYLQVPVP